MCSIAPGMECLSLFLQQLCSRAQPAGTKSQRVWFTLRDGTGACRAQDKAISSTRRTGKASWKRQPLSWALMAGQNLNV